MIGLGMIISVLLVVAPIAICTDAVGVKLRHRWENRPPQLEFARKMVENQHDCKKQRGSYGLNQYGMGSGLISLSHAMCTCMEHDCSAIVQKHPTDWIWNDVEFCKTQNSYNSTLGCYFGPLFNQCPPIDKNEGLYWVNFVKCPHVVNHPGNLKGIYHFHANTFEYLFSHVNPEIVRRAEVEAEKIFGPSGSPDNMITVHIRYAFVHGTITISHFSCSDGAIRLTKWGDPL
jgi:hypothetical protein